ncbi:MAG TPA: ATP-binding protein [Candidatus Eisenbacteria bacterium]|nr:ATP-binding protein [Candidatus Eisenbacteria bacterium]
MGPTSRRLYFSLLVLFLAIAVIAGIWFTRAPGSISRVWLLLAFGVLATAVAMYVVIAALARRLEAVERVADRLAQGDFTARAAVDAHDDLAGLARSLNEIAERGANERRALERGRDESAAALDNLPQGVALLAPDLTVRHANSRFWDAMEVEPPNAGAHLSIARQPVLVEVVEDARRAGRAVTREISLYVSAPREVEASVAPVGAGESPEAWLLTVEDLAPERRAAAIRREFVANASHELKTPLTSILGYTETLLHGGLDDAEHRAKFVETIRVQATRLEAMVDDLLSLADLERPDAELDLKDWDLGIVIRELAETLEDLAERRGLRFEIEAAPGTSIRCDRKRLELALRNLMDNAIKYTESGWVRVRLEPGPTRVRVTVADSGRGIPPEHLPRLFERFYRVEQGRSRALGGTGLGLSIVKHAVQLHGGTVGVESKVDEGSVFWLELPRSGPVA